ncbi:MAG: hypothetical protein NC543_04505 [bacterium]|nr:hypothetical protein [bacterium]MCM1374799.1 hypothetical protein [Muribaculum sp.]
MSAIAGGYQVHPQIGEQEKAVFEYAMKDHVGMNFEPVAVATQVVNGINYIFICTGSPVVLHPETELYAVQIYTQFAHSVAPKVEIKSIEQIDVAKLVG